MWSIILGLTWFAIGAAAFCHKLEFGKRIEHNKRIKKDEIIVLIKSQMLHHNARIICIRIAGAVMMWDGWVQFIGAVRLFF